MTVVLSRFGEYNVTRFCSYVGRRFDTLEAVQIDVKNGVIHSVRSVSVPDSDLPYVGPGFFDIQVNGAVGIEFSSSKLTEEGVVSILEKMLHDGVFRICPTITTNAPETMIKAARVIASALERRPEYASIVWGIHLEDRYFSCGGAVELILNGIVSPIHEICLT